jgi:hypothetical protein
VDLPDGWPVVEVPGATLLPGLIDTHVHLCGDSRTGALDRLPGYGDAELAGVIEHGRRGTSAGAGRDHGTHRHDLAGTRGPAGWGSARAGCGRAPTPTCCWSTATR